MFLGPDRYANAGRHEGLVCCEFAGRS
jgi:hypothetical protein